MLIPGATQQVARGREHVGLQVGIGCRDRARRHLAAERRRRFDRERVRADVLRRQVDRLLQRPLPRVQALAVRAVDEVEVHVLVAGGAGGDERPSHAVGRVQALERLEHAAIERLRAHRQPVEPGREQPVQLLRVHGVGVGLDRDLGGVAHDEPVADVRQHTLQIGDIERGRRASAEEDRHDLVVRPCGRGQAGLRQERPDVSRRQVIQARIRVEVAVAAARQAERHVDVDPDVGHFFFSLAPPSSTRNAAMNASCGTSTRPTRRMRAFPRFCSSSSLRLRVMSPP